LPIYLHPASNLLTIGSLLQTGKLLNEMVKSYFGLLWFCWLSKVLLSQQ